MTEWQELMRAADADPLTTEETAWMRRTVLEEAARPQPATDRLSTAIIGGVLAVAVAAGVSITRGVPDQPAPVQPRAPGGSVRQLQFATPGGTRIIWQFNPEFSLRETIP